MIRSTKSNQSTTGYWRSKSLDYLITQQMKCLTACCPHNKLVKIWESFVFCKCDQFQKAVLLVFDYKLVWLAFFTAAYKSVVYLWVKHATNTVIFTYNIQIQFIRAIFCFIHLCKPYSKTLKLLPMLVIQNLIVKKHLFWYSHNVQYLIPNYNPVQQKFLTAIIYLYPCTANRSASAVYLCSYTATFPNLL